MGSPANPQPAENPATSVLGALILFCGDLELSLAFYRTLGLPLEHESHGEGPLHYACDVQGLHMALFSGLGDGAAAPHRTPGSMLPGWKVPRLERTLERLMALGARVVAPAELYPWGMRALVEDPDGRVLELFADPDRD